MLRRTPVTVLAPDGRRWDKAGVTWDQDDAQTLYGFDGDGPLFSATGMTWVPVSQRVWEFHGPDGVWTVTAARSCGCGG